MNNIEQNCPNCGANVPIPKNIYDSLHITCAYCNTLLHIKPIKTPSHFNGTNSYNIKIYGINKKRDKKINKVQTVILILSTVVPLIFLLVFFGKHTAIDFISSGKIICSGNEHLSLLNKQIVYIEAKENCLVILNDVRVISNSTALHIRDNARITIINSKIEAKDVAINAADNVKILIMNSTIFSKNTVFSVFGKAAIKVINCTATGMKNLYIKNKNSKINLNSSTTKGKMIEEK